MSTPKQREFWQSEVFARESGGKPTRPDAGTWHEPARELRVFKRTDVLVVGGGPAGTAAAVAAARLGAEVTLVERYNHLGGLSTGGLVVWIDRMTDWEGKRVIAGFAEEILDRLPRDAVAGPAPDLWGTREPSLAAHWALRTAAFHGVVTHSPTIDPEWLKFESLRMVRDAGVDLLLHAWAAAPIIEDGAVAGVVFESKAGRQAIRSTVVVDTTGDGDIYAGAGAESESDIDVDDIHHCMNVSWLFAGVDMPQWLAFRAGDPEGYQRFMALGRARIGSFEKPFVSWRDDVALFMGPRRSGYSALDIDDLNAVEWDSRRLMMAHLEFYRAHAPGFASAWVALSAPQMGVRHARRLAGVLRVAREHWDGRVHPDEIGVSPSPGLRFPKVSIPYRALIPARLDGLLAAGRHIACDPSSHSFLREIPQCWVTGQAAGAAAALAAQCGVAPRHVDVEALRRALTGQGAHLQNPPLPPPDQRTSSTGTGER